MPSPCPAVPVHVGMDVCKNVFILPNGQALELNNARGRATRGELKQQSGRVALALLEATGRYERRCEWSKKGTTSRCQARGLSRARWASSPSPGAIDAATEPEFARLGHVRTCEKQPEPRSLLDG